MGKALSSFCLAIALILFFYSGASASFPVDSSLSKPYKLSQKAFLKKYGTDDSSRALIRYYFNKRNWLRNAALVYAALACTGYLILNAIVTQTSGDEDRVVNGKGVFAAVLVSAFGLAAPIVAYRWLRTSRKRLFKMLNDYRMDKSIPKKLMRSSSFQRFMSMEETE
jgi:hypothetical protein